MKQGSIKSRGEVILYEAPDGQVRVDVRLERETVWLTQDQMSQLFGRERSVIAKHIRNVFRERELEPEATSAKFARVQILGNMQKMHIAFKPSGRAGRLI